MSTYRVGSGTSQITLEVDINTFGLAASRAIVLNILSQDPETTVGHSLNATGDIPLKDIGTRDFLVGKRLSIMTKIDLLGDLPERKKEAERLSAKYTLDQGPNGPLSVSDPMKVISKDFKTVILYREFDLII